MTIFYDDVMMTSPHLVQGVEALPCKGEYLSLSDSDGVVGLDSPRNKVLHRSLGGAKEETRSNTCKGSNSHKRTDN